MDKDEAEDRVKSWQAHGTEQKKTHRVGNRQSRQKATRRLAVSQHSERCATLLPHGIGFSVYGWGSAFSSMRTFSERKKNRRAGDGKECSQLPVLDSLNSNQTLAPLWPRIVHLTFTHPRGSKYLMRMAFRG